MASEFWPKDTGKQFYLYGKTDLQTIMNRAHQKWSGITLSEIEIEPEYVHTDHLTHDLYDSSDWANFLCITASDEYFERVMPVE